MLSYHCNKRKLVTYCNKGRMIKISKEHWVKIKEKESVVLQITVIIHLGKPYIKYIPTHIYSHTHLSSLYSALALSQNQQVQCYRHMFILYKNKISKLRKRTSKRTHHLTTFCCEASSSTHKHS